MSGIVFSVPPTQNIATPPKASSAAIFVSAQTQHWKGILHSILLEPVELEIGNTRSCEKQWAEKVLIQKKDFPYKIQEIRDSVNKFMLWTTWSVQLLWKGSSWVTVQFTRCTSTDILSPTPILVSTWSFWSQIHLTQTAVKLVLHCLNSLHPCGIRPSQEWEDVYSVEEEADHTNTFLTCCRLGLAQSTCCWLFGRMYIAPVTRNKTLPLSCTPPCATSCNCAPTQEPGK